MVLVLRPRVENVRVRQKLDIANIKNHVQRKAIARLLKDFSSFELSGRQRRDDASVGEASEGADVVWVPSCRFSVSLDVSITGNFPRTLSRLASARLTRCRRRLS